MSKRSEGQTPDPLQRREKFCQEYALTGIGWESAKKAGYEGDYDTLITTACRLLGNARVLDRLAEIRSQLFKKHGVDRDYIVRNLTAIIDFDPTPMLKLDKDGHIVAKKKGSWPRNAAKFVGLTSSRSNSSSAEGYSESRSFALKLAQDKVKAIELLSKMGGFLNEKKPRANKGSGDAIDERVLGNLRKRKK